MNNEKTITITRKNEKGETELVDVKMRYCMASENGFEDITGKPSSVLSATPIYDEDGNQTGIEPAKATNGDLLALAVACIIAAYERNKEKPPLTAGDILYECSPADINTLLMTVAELRAEWYKVTDAIDSKDSADSKKGKRGKNR